METSPSRSTRAGLVFATSATWGEGDVFGVYADGAGGYEDASI
jgi:hypothetical protein